MRHIHKALRFPNIRKIHHLEQNMLEPRSIWSASILSNIRLHYGPFYLHGDEASV